MISVQNPRLPLNGNSVKYLLLLCFIFGQNVLNAQDTRKIDGQKYQVHEVEKGHTLYAISKKYSIEIDQIIEHNPGVKDGLSIGEEVLIPVKEIDRKAARDNPPEIKGKYLEHLVEKKETLFSISRKYNINVNSLLEHNPGADKGIQPGQVLKIFVGDIPVKNPEVVAPAVQDSLIVHKVQPGDTYYSVARAYSVTVDSLRALNNLQESELPIGFFLRIPRYTSEYLAKGDTMEVEEFQPFLSGTRATYKVGLMLPFSTEIQDSLLQNQDRTKPLDLYTLTRISAEMYRGVRMAVDSIAKSGLSIELFVYEVSDDLLALDDLLKKTEPENLHLIIGPLHRESYKKVSSWAAPHGIRVVAPVPNQKLKTDYRGSCIVHSNAIQQMQFLGRYTSRMHFTDNVVLVDSDKFTDYDFVQGFLSAYQSPNGRGDTVKIVKLEKYGIESLEKKLDKNKRNIVVVPSSDLGFVSDFMNRISNINRDDYDIVVMGMEKWLDYQNIDMQYKNRFKVTVPSSTYLNFDEPRVEQFIEAYLQQYEQQPASDGYAFLGFDVAWFFLNALDQFGLDFPRHYKDLEQEGIHLGFRFEQHSNGTFNQHIFLLQYDNYELKRIN